MTQILTSLSQLTPHWRYLGAAAIPFIVGRFPNGQKEIVLGKYLWSGPASAEFKSNLSWVYSNDPSFQSPKILWLKGHFYDLIRKAVAVAFFYLTFPVIPAKISSRFSDEFKSWASASYPIIIWAPVILKLFHFALEGLTLPETAKPLKQRVEQLQSWVMSNWYASHMVIAAEFSFAVGDYFFRKGKLSSYLAGLTLLVTARLLGTLMRISLPKNVPSLSELPDLFKKIPILPPAEENNLEDVADLFRNCCDSVKRLENARMINLQEKINILAKISESLNLFLDSRVFQRLLTKNDLSILENSEDELREIFEMLNQLCPARGSLPYYAARYRFTTVLLYTNLRRLKAKQSELTPKQFRYMQYGLREQAMNTISGWTGIKVPFPQGDQSAKVAFTMYPAIAIHSVDLNPDEMDHLLVVLLNTLSSPLTPDNEKIIQLEKEVSKRETQKPAEQKTREATERNQFIKFLTQQKKPLTFNNILEAAKKRS